MKPVVLAASIAALMVCAGLAPSAVGAECARTYNQPKIPKGINASEDEMRDAQEAVQTYVNELEEYQKCLEDQIANAPDIVTNETKMKWRAWGNNAVTDAERAAQEFKIQLQTYRDRSKPPPPKKSPLSGLGGH